jgi:Fe-S cluster assembly protein SufB
MITANKGLNKKLVVQISEQKNEPGWMTDFRLQALTFFEQKPMPTWGANLSDLDPDDIYYYLKPIEQQTSWDEIPDTVKNTFEKLGILAA